MEPGQEQIEIQGGVGHTELTLDKTNGNNLREGPQPLSRGLDRTFQWKRWWQGVTGRAPGRGRGKDTFGY